MFTEETFQDFWLEILLREIVEKSFFFIYVFFV